MEQRRRFTFFYMRSVVALVSLFWCPAIVSSSRQNQCIRTHAVRSKLVRITWKRPLGFHLFPAPDSKLVQQIYPRNSCLRGLPLLLEMLMSSSRWQLLVVFSLLIAIYFCSPTSSSSRDCCFHPCLNPEFCTGESAVDWVKRKEKYLSSYRPAANCESIVRLTLVPWWDQQEIKHRRSPSNLVDLTILDATTPRAIISSSWYNYHWIMSAFIIKDLFYLERYPEEWMVTNVRREKANSHA